MAISEGDDDDDDDVTNVSCGDDCDGFCGDNNNEMAYEDLGDINGSANCIDKIRQRVQHSLQSSDERGFVNLFLDLSEEKNKFKLC